MKQYDDFNYEIIVDDIYLNEKLILHIVDIATIFQTNRFLNKMLAKKI